MKKENKHMGSEVLPDDLDKLSGRSAIRWQKSSAEVWSEIEKQIAGSAPATVRLPGRSWLMVAATILITIITGTSAIMMLYTRTVDVPAGMHSEIYLPDNSMVKINAGSTLSYKPGLWLFSRNLHFEGEAYFEVQKGGTFTVKSENGSTEVLGTSFNIYSRDRDYQVTCISGKVKVLTANNNNEIVLAPGEKTELDTTGNFRLFQNADTGQIISWINNILSFTSVPVKEVFNEISLQYGILIRYNEEMDFIYTGTFPKDPSPEKILNLICRPFDLKVVSESENEYVITTNQ